MDAPPKVGMWLAPFAAWEHETEYPIMFGYWFLIAAIYDLQTGSLNLRSYINLIELDYCGTCKQPLQKCLSKIPADAEPFELPKEVFPKRMTNFAASTCWHFHSKFPNVPNSVSDQV